MALDEPKNDDEVIDEKGTKFIIEKTFSVRQNRLTLISLQPRRAQALN